MKSVKLKLNGPVHEVGLSLLILTRDEFQLQQR